MRELALVDILVGAAVGVGLILGLVRGFLLQVTGLLGIIGGLLLADRYNGWLQTSVIDKLFSSRHNGTIAFIVIVVATILVVALISLWSRKLMDRMKMGAYDRLLGAIFGGLKACILCAGILLVVVVMAPDGGSVERSIGKSHVGRFFWDGMEEVSKVLPERMESDFRKILRENRLPSEPADEDPDGAPDQEPSGG